MVDTRSMRVRVSAVTTSQRQQPPLRCTLRRRFDPPCSGAAEVQIRDRYGTTAWGCITHASLALAGIRGSTIVDQTRHGAAIEAHRLAQDIRRDRRDDQPGGVTWW